MSLDRTPRYVPDSILVVHNGKYGHHPVIGSRFYPANQHPSKCPIVSTMGALEVCTEHGSRWYGVEEASINSELRMVVVGFNSAFEELRGWAVVTD